MAEQNNNLYVKVARRVMENGVWYTLTAFPLPHHHSSSRNKHKLASRLGHVSVVKHIDCTPCAACNGRDPCRTPWQQTKTVWQHHIRTRLVRRMYRRARLAVCCTTCQCKQLLQAANSMTRVALAVSHKQPCKAKPRPSQILGAMYHSPSYLLAWHGTHGLVAMTSA